MEKSETVYIVPLKCGKNILVPNYSKITYYKPGTLETVEPPFKIITIPPQRYRICSDERGHNYFIPVEKVEEFYNWVRATEEGNDSGLLSFDNNRIDGRFSFADPECEK